MITDPTGAAFIVATFAALIVYFGWLLGEIIEMFSACADDARLGIDDPE